MISFPPPPTSSTSTYQHLISLSNTPARFAYFPPFRFSKHAAIDVYGVRVSPFGAIGRACVDIFHSFPSFLLEDANTETTAIFISIARLSHFFVPRLLRDVHSCTCT